MHLQGVPLQVWNAQFFTFIGSELRQLIEIHLVTMARETLTEDWLKLEVSNREDIPHIMEVDFTIGLSAINIKSLSCEKISLTEISGPHQKFKLAQGDIRGLLVDGEKCDLHVDVVGNSIKDETMNNITAGRATMN